jgi:hypothetical protein
VALGLFTDIKTHVFYPAEKDTNIHFVQALRLYFGNVSFIKKALTHFAANI